MTKRSKLNLMIATIKKYGNPQKIGVHAVNARIKIYQTMTMPTLYHNMECWSHIPNNIYKELDRIQYEILRRIFEQKTATPYWGLLAEIGLWPIQQYLDYKRILLFARVIQSEENRLIKRIIEDQIKNPYGRCWAKLSLETIEKYNLDLEEIRKGKVAKNQIKKAITRAVEEESSVQF